MAHCACSPLLRHCFCCTERWPSSRQCLSCKRNRTAWFATLFVRAQIFCFSSTLHSIALAKVQSQVLHCCVPLSLCLILHLVELSHASHHQLGANNDCPLPLHCCFLMCASCGRSLAWLVGLCSAVTAFDLYLRCCMWEDAFALMKTYRQDVSSSCASVCVFVCMCVTLSMVLLLLRLPAVDGKASADSTHTDTHRHRHTHRHTQTQTQTHTHNCFRLRSCFRRCGCVWMSAGCCAHM